MRARHARTIRDAIDAARRHMQGPRLPGAVVWIPSTDRLWLRAFNRELRRIVEGTRR